MPNSRQDSPSNVQLAKSGKPTYNQTVQSTGTAATSTALDGGQMILVQADAAGYMLIGASPTVSSSNGVKLAADALAGPYTLASGDTVVQWISGTGTTNLKIFTLS